MCLVEGTRVVVERSAGGLSWKLQCVGNFFRLDNAATPPGSGDSHAARTRLWSAACRMHTTTCVSVGCGSVRSAELASVCATACACARQNQPLFVPLHALAAAAC